MHLKNRIIYLFLGKLHSVSPATNIPRTAKQIAMGLLFALLLPTFSHAQKQEKATIPLDHFYVKRKKRIVRAILSRLTWGASLGYGNTFFSHTLNNFTLHQGATGGPDISSNKSATRYQNWINRLEEKKGDVLPRDFVVNTDTTKLAFEGNALNIPITLTLHYEFSRYRVGVGYTYEFVEIGELHPLYHGNRIRAFRPSQYSGSITKYFGLLGVSFYQWHNVLFTGDIAVGGLILGSNFAENITDAGLHVNIGVRAEYAFSEYLKAFIRPSFEFKNYTLSLPEQGANIMHNMNALYVSVGLSYRLPKLPRCFHPACKAQIDHVHGNKEYRSRVHSIFKKQHPHYAENYRMSKAAREKYRGTKRVKKKKK